MLHVLKKISLFSALYLSQILVSSTAYAEWNLDSEASYLSYVSIKKGVVGEANFFEKLSGKVGDDGVAEVTIEMGSVQTNIDVRNERMKEHVFKVSEFPKGIVTSEIDLDEYQDMPVGDTIQSDISLVGQFMGAEVEFDVTVNVTRIAENKVSVTNRDIIVATANDFGATDGLNKLKELAQLPSIEPVVPVSFQMIFQK